jgi:hypothetical protein
VIVEIETAAPESVPAEVLVVPFAGTASGTFRRFDGLVGGRLAGLIASGEAKSEAGATVVLHVAPGEQVAAARIAVVGVGRDDDFDEDSVRTAAGAAARCAKGLGGTVVWAFDGELPLDAHRQVSAAV